MSSKLETGARVTHTWSLSHAHAHAPTVTRTGWQSVAESILLFDAPIVTHSGCLLSLSVIPAAHLKRLKSALSRPFPFPVFPQV